MLQGRIGNENWLLANSLPHEETNRSRHPNPSDKPLCPCAYYHSKPTAPLNFLLIADGKGSVIAQYIIIFIQSKKYFSYFIVPASQLVS